MIVSHKPLFLLACVLFLATGPNLLAQGDKNGKPTLIIIDNSGKEHKLTSWKFTTGTRHLNWLASDEEKKDAKKPAEIGPEVLELSEGKKTLFAKRVLTWIPIKHIRSLEHDAKNSLVKVDVGTDKVLEGPTGYTGINILSIEAEDDLGEFGKAKIKFVFGVAQGVKKITFSAPTPLDGVPKGRIVAITTTDTNNKSFAATDLQPVYQQNNLALKLDPSLSFQETVRIETDKMEQLSRVGPEAGLKGGLVFDVKLKSGAQKPLVLIETRAPTKTTSETLLGLVGRVDVGYKLVPMATLQLLNFDQAVEPPKEEKKVAPEKNG